MTLVRQTDIDSCNSVESLEIDLHYIKSGLCIIDVLNSDILHTSDIFWFWMQSLEFLSHVP